MGGRSIDRQPYCEQPEDPYTEDKDERGVSLSDALNGGVDPLAYDYDFSDDWRHLVEVEEQMKSLPNDQPVLCTDGANACPPEDSGGAYWCAEQRIENPEQYAGEAFNLVRINSELREYIEWSREQDED